MEVQKISEKIRAKISHCLLETKSDDKNVRINSRSYTKTTGDISAYQTKPSQTVTGTTTLVGGESSPRFQDACGGASLIGYKSNPDLKGTTGDLTGDVRAYEGRVESASGSTRTIAGTAAVLHAMNSLHGTVTGGAFVIAVDAAGGNVAWSGFAEMADDEQVASVDAAGKLVDISGTANDGWMKVKVGAEVKYIALYNEKTS